MAAFRPSLDHRQIFWVNRDCRPDGRYVGNGINIVVLLDRLALCDSLCSDEPRYRGLNFIACQILPRLTQDALPVSAALPLRDPPQFRLHSTMPGQHR